MVPRFPSKWNRDQNPAIVVLSVIEMKETDLLYAKIMALICSTLKIFSLFIIYTHVSHSYHAG